MKNILKYSLMLMVLVAGFASCADEYKSYTPATADTDQVYFSKDLSSVFELGDFTENQIIIPVTRQKTDKEITVELGLIDESNFYTLQTKQVTFPAGVAKADAIVTFDATTLDYDEYPEATIYIVDGVVEPEDLLIPEPEEEGGEEATPAEGEGSEEAAEPAEDEKEETPKPTPKYTTAWGNPTFTFSVGVPAPFESLGMGKFADNFWEEGECDVEILRNTINPKIYRVVDPYGSFGASYYDDNRTKYMEIELLEPGDKLWETEITMNDLVFFSRFNTGYLHSSYGAYVELFHPAYFYDDEASYAHNKVVGYQEDGTPGLIQLAPYFYMVGVGGWNHTTDDGCVTILFPGYVPKDLSAEITYKGIFINVAEEAHAMVTGTFGADVTDVRGVVVPADADNDAVADAIMEGELEATEIDLSDPNNIIVPLNDQSGDLKVVLVVVDDGAVKTVTSANFEYYGGGGDANPWQSIGIGLYTDNFLAPVYGGDEPTVAGPYEVEILENKENPGLYRLVNCYGEPHPWYSPEDNYTPTNFEIDATDPDGVIIYMQSTGANWGYGMIYAGSFGGYMAQSKDFATLKEEGYLGKVEEGIVTLPTFTTESGREYQGIHMDDDGAYYAGIRDGFRLVLPSAVTEEARQRAIRPVAWMNYGKRNAKKIEKKDMSLFEKANLLRK